VTNWENGKFRVDDIVWALGVVREKMPLVGGDMCGAWSKQQYATLPQKIAGWFDHPTERRDLGTRGPINDLARQRIWPALTGTGE
jgi:hypothetical protein